MKMKSVSRLVFLTGSNLWIKKGFAMILKMCLIKKTTGFLNEDVIFEPHQLHDYSPIPDR
jgi:hypothetical protein